MTERRSRRALTVVIVVLGLLAPLAEFFYVRLLVRAPTALASFGMPWPAPIADGVQVLSVAVVAAMMVAAVFGIVVGSDARWAGLAAIVFAVFAVPVALIANVTLTFGDPGNG